MTTLAYRIKRARKLANLTQKALAEAIGVSQPVISQLENGENQQSVHLLRIATICGVQPAWLAEGTGEMVAGLFVNEEKPVYASAQVREIEPPSSPPPSIGDLDELKLPAAVRRRLSSAKMLEEDHRYLVIPRFDIAASMGPGIVVPEHLEVIQQLVVDREWIREQRLIHTGVPNLAIITGFGDSMLGTFSDGDPLMVDRGVNSMDKDGIYVFSVDGAAHIKRLQRVGGSRVKVISDNPTYDRWEADLADIMIHARVLIGLNVRKME